MVDSFYVHDLVLVPLFAVSGHPHVSLGRVVDVDVGHERSTAIRFSVPFDAHLHPGERVHVTVPDIRRLDWTDTSLTVWSPSFERSCTENLTCTRVKCRLKALVERVLRRALRERHRRISAQRTIAPWWLHAAYRPGGCMYRRLCERWECPRDCTCASGEAEPTGSAAGQVEASSS